MASEPLSNAQVCIIIGASHAGVNCAFALRKEGWKGKIILFDKDDALPYHRPPLSKTYLTSLDETVKNSLKSAESYTKADILLQLGIAVQKINPTARNVQVSDGRIIDYDKLVLAVGASPVIPPIKGIDAVKNVFALRTAVDAQQIRQAILQSQQKRVVFIGGGYIGLEAAASLRRLGGEVTLLERENRILARVTTPEMSNFFKELHEEKGVSICTNKNIIAIKKVSDTNQVTCNDGTAYLADLIIVGVGVKVNQELAEKAGLVVENGIRVDPTTRTNDENIYAIGDCTFHYNPFYEQNIRLENIQNAVDQAKVAAAAICGKNPVYNAIPWFWSDQYDTKLQIVGLAAQHQEALVRREIGEKISFSIWYFDNDRLLAVEAINHPKAYVLGTKFIKSGQKIDKKKLIDSTVPFKPVNFLLD